ncbi:MAG: hypothetical protein AAB909_04020 [Patescibacteria group bacterium]
MKNTLNSYLLTLLLVGVTNTQAADKKETTPDFQLRLPVHIQYVGLYTNHVGRFGLAAWNIFSDVTHEDDPTATFSILGPLWQYDKKGSWFEIMGGVRRGEDGYVDPAIDIRLHDRTLSWIHITAELAYFPREERRRLYGYLAVDTPIRLGTYQMSVGFESENIISYSGKEDSFGIGPRLVLPIPWIKKISPSLSSSFTLAYQHRNDRDFVRCYLGCMYVFGKK